VDKTNSRELANFLDTEGYIGIIKVGNYTRNQKPTFFGEAVISNTDKRWLENIKSKWGGRIYPVQKGSPEWEQAWHLKFHSENLLQILDIVRPYLKMKVEQCGIVKELQQRVSNRIGLDIRGRMTVQERDYRHKLYMKCRLLNERGEKARQLVLDEPKPQLKLNF